MSMPTTSPEEIPEDVKELFDKYLKKEAEKDDQDKLFRWILGMQKDPKFNLLSLVMEGYGWEKRDYNRLEQALRTAKKRLEMSAASKLKELEQGDFASFIEKLWSEAKTIATETIMTWFERAREYGYYDAETGRVRMKEFIEDSCNFYIQNKENLEILMEQVNDSEAAAKLFADVAKPNFLRLTALRLYTQFMSQVIALGARGIPVPESIIMDVKETTNQIILSAGMIPVESK